MLTDAQYFKTKIGSLDGAGDVGDYIVNLVKEKLVPKDEMPATMEKDETAANGKSSSEVISADAGSEDIAPEPSNDPVVKTEVSEELQAA